MAPRSWNSSAHDGPDLSEPAQRGSRNNNRWRFWTGWEWHSPVYLCLEAYRAIAAAFETLSDPNPPAASIFTS